MTNDQAPAIHVMTDEEQQALVESSHQSASKLILLDYDGTLVPYVDNPALARPERRTMDLLASLTANSANRIVIISGRDRQTLENWFTGLRLDLVAEHGAYHKAGTTEQWTSPHIDSGLWKSAIEKVFDKYSKELPGSFVEKKDHSIAWHYRIAPVSDECLLRERICKELATENVNNHFNIICGNKVIETKNSQFDKGQFTVQFLTGNTFDFVLAIGDDTTDEDMFGRLSGPNQFSIRVGYVNTKARYNVRDLSEVYSLLEKLC
jgi:trehalose 6-phosphate synthase/phosphatase